MVPCLPLRACTRIALRFKPDCACLLQVVWKLARLQLLLNSSPAAGSSSPTPPQLLTAAVVLDELRIRCVACQVFWRLAFVRTPPKRPSLLLSVLCNAQLSECQVLHWLSQV